MKNSSKNDNTKKISGVTQDTSDDGLTKYNVLKMKNTLPSYKAIYRMPQQHFMLTYTQSLVITSMLMQGQRSLGKKL